MDLFKPKQPQSSLLAAPRARGLSNAAGDRLSTIDENPLNLGASRDAINHSGDGNRTPGSLPRHSAESKPPSYQRHWPVEGQSYSEKAGFTTPPKSRGGWGRFAIIGAIVFAIVVALAVGLGVGLTRNHKSSSNSNSSSSSSGTTPNSTPGSAQSFPIGEFTFVTALRSVQTNCTSNAATWRCYPYDTYTDSDSTSGLTFFNWVLSSTSSSFPVNTTTTDSAGIPANITLSSASNPFSMNITSQNLTYINNNNSPRYTFSFYYQQPIVPSTSIDSTNVAATCLYNETLFSATLYLSDAQTTTYPGAGLTNSSAVNGGYTRWPYAVEIVESVGGGANVPACYQTTNGALGAQVGSFTNEGPDAQCQCMYSNF